MVFLPPSAMIARSTQRIGFSSFPYIGLNLVHHNRLEGKDDEFHIDTHPRNILITGMFLSSCYRRSRSSFRGIRPGVMNPSSDVFFSTALMDSTFMKSLAGTCRDEHCSSERPL